MTQISASELTRFDIEFLRGEWQGPKGAAYNAVFEDLRESGIVDWQGQLTPYGEQLLEEIDGNVSNAE